MDMERPFARENQQSRQRLKSLIDRLSEQDLQRSVGPGWTVAAALVHLAYWDSRALVLLRRWQRDGLGPSPVDVDAVNDALLPLARAMPPRAAARLALEAAEAVDAELEALPQTLLAEIQAGVPFRVSRAIHREEHLREIEALLGGADAG